MLRYPFVHPLVFVAANYKVVGEEAPTIPLSVSIEGFNAVREALFFRERDTRIDNPLERLVLRDILLESQIMPCIERVKKVKRTNIVGKSIRTTTDKKLEQKIGQNQLTNFTSNMPKLFCWKHYS